MADAPTRGAHEPGTAWRAHPGFALAVRCGAFVVPVVAAYLTIRLVGPWLYRPRGRIGLVVWILQAAALGALVSNAVGRVTRRLLPLATLLRLTLIFPDRAPSRFGVALRSGTVRQMRRRARELERDGLGFTAAEAAENAIVIVNGLGRHDRLTRGHTERVRAYADLIAEEMGLSETDRSGLAWGVLLHDVGKVTVPAEVLNKSERLTDEEWALLKRHPEAGAEMLRPLAPWLGQWAGAAGEHHERWDGRGYPKGLKDHEISLAGRITAVADAYDVITSKRSYKAPMSAEAARQELVDCSATQFDPAVVRAMLAVSIGRSPAVGSLAWLTEIPVVGAAVGVGASPVAGVVGTAAIATAALLGLADDSPARRSAFASELESLSRSPIVVVDMAEEPDVSLPRPVGAGTTTVAEPTNTEPTNTEPTNIELPVPEPPVPTLPKLPAPTTTSPTIPPVTTSTTPFATPTTAPPATTSTVPSTSPAPVGPAPATAPPPASEADPESMSTVPATVPLLTVPSLDVPSLTVPSLNVPSLTVPPISTPVITVPSISTPTLTTPPITIPSISTPTLTTPLLTTPDLSVPEIVLPTPRLGGLLG